MRFADKKSVLKIAQGLFLLNYKLKLAIPSSLKLQLIHSSSNSAPHFL